MKKTFALIMIVSSAAASVFAQQDELKSATTNIENKEYVAALDNLSKAKRIVNKLMTDQLSEVLPAKFGEFEMTESDGMGAMEDGQGISLERIYRKPISTDQNKPGMDDPMMNMGNEPQLNVRITTNMMMANEVMNAHTMSSERMKMDVPGMESEAYRVKGYRALSKSYGGDSTEGEGESMEPSGQQKIQEAHAIVGGAYIVVTAMGVDKDGEAKALLKQVDFDKLIGIVGK
ncbi:MAG: hypothetical protein H6603_08380 [Flavobacteriales bacterium]|nr:hypothetical protein [Flavobacteriales bacterium]MCB9191958.1 hypothetical protein [Flavobacteriales bacterium]MCB9204978.1 hypothetical protein [Flavobacteriales bacterium]